MIMKTKSKRARRPNRPAHAAGATTPVSPADRSFPVIAMAASAGGLKALSVILGGLPADFPAAITIVMHLAPGHKSLLAEILNSRSHLKVKQAHTGDLLSPSSVFIAPPNHHLSVAKGGRLELSSSAAGKVNYARPSAEPLFVSVADVYKKNAIAVVLTGGDGDGSFGVQIIKDKGGQVIAQDRATSENFSMPETSIQTGDVDFILPLDKIAPKLMELVVAGSGRKNGRTAAESGFEKSVPERARPRAQRRESSRPARKVQATRASNVAAPEDGRTPSETGTASKTNFPTGSKSRMPAHVPTKPVTPHFSAGTKAAMIKGRN